MMKSIRVKKNCVTATCRKKAKKSDRSSDLPGWTTFKGKIVSGKVPDRVDKDKLGMVTV